MTRTRGRWTIRRRRRRMAHLDGAVVIRDMTENDLQVTYDLYTAYATEQFGENYSYDRWGPGVPVPFDDVDELPTQELDPSVAVRRQLTDLATHDGGLVLLAELDGSAIGFLTGGLLPTTPTGPPTEGRIDDLYVAPSVRRRGIGTTLIDAATARLRRAGATILRVDIDPTTPGAEQFWERQPDWVNDVRCYRNYQ